MAAWITGAFFVLSVSAYYLIKEASYRVCQGFHACGLDRGFDRCHRANDHRPYRAETVAKYQPTKLAVMEGHFPANEPADMYLFGYVDEKDQQVRYGLKIPGFVSYLMYGDASTVAGIKSFKKEDHAADQYCLFKLSFDDCHRGFIIHC